MSKILRGKPRAAFSLIELLISIVILAILGGTVVQALNVMLSSFRHNDDYVTARYEIGFAFDALKPQFANIGLGMPNNAAQRGSFSSSFASSAGNTGSIMSYMGAKNQDWGGPVTVAKKGAHSAGISNLSNNFVKMTVKDSNNADVYVGNELFYSWAVPTGEKIASSTEIGEVENDEKHIEMKLVNHDTSDGGAVSRLVNFQYDGRNIGISNTNRNTSSRAWFVLPSFRVPFLIEEDVGGDNAIDNIENKLKVQVSPFSKALYGISLGGSLNAYDEIHLVQTACIFAENGVLKQRIYDTPSVYTDKVIASNIIDVCFTFEPAKRILNMYIAARGNSRGDMSNSEIAKTADTYWPSFQSAPPLNLSSEDAGSRVLIESLTWRIKN